MRAATRRVGLTRPERTAFPAWTGALLLAALAATGCDARAPTSAPGAATTGPPGATESAEHTGPEAARDVPPALRDCAQCHARIVQRFMAHGMSDSLGLPDDTPHGTLLNPTTGTRYELLAEGDATTLTATLADGGRRRQRIVGRIGAGVLDMSFVGAEIDPVGRVSGRLFFAPIERITGVGLALAPFELGPQPAGLDQPVTSECLQCHTTDDPARLPGAAATRGAARGVAHAEARADTSGGKLHVYPGHALGADAFLHLSPLGCSACHGDTRRHVDVMHERTPATGDDIGIARLSELPAGEQRDVCARCHLEGDAHLHLPPRSAQQPPLPAGAGAETQRSQPQAGAAGGYGPHAGVLHGMRPALVPAHPDDDFRFVSQVERLALSECFLRSPGMTCTSCHAAHDPVSVQGTAAFDRACIACHAGGRADCARDESLSVPDVTGTAARTADGCVDCHVRRSQPFDLPLVISADHNVRRHIPQPARITMRHFADPDGPLAPFDDGRLRDALATPGGKAWAAGLAGAGLFREGRLVEAAELLDTLEHSGAEAAAADATPALLAPLRGSAALLHIRALVMEASGRADGARDLYGEALALDPWFPEPRLNRALLRVSAGATEDGLADAELLLALYPESEKAWNVRALAAARAGDVPAAAAALAASTDLWGSDPLTWRELGRLLAALGRREQALTALQQAALLRPSLPGLQAELSALEQP